MSWSVSSLTVQKGIRLRLSKRAVPLSPRTSSPQRFGARSPRLLASGNLQSKKNMEKSKLSQSAIRFAPRKCKFLTSREKTSWLLFFCAIWMIPDHVFHGPGKHNLCVFLRIFLGGSRGCDFSWLGCRCYYQAKRVSCSHLGEEVVN